PICAQAAFSFDESSSDPGVAPKTLFPEVVTQDDVVVVAGGILPRGECASKLWTRAQNGEKFSRHDGTRESHWFTKAREIELMPFGVRGYVHGAHLFAHRHK